LQTLRADIDYSRGAATPPMAQSASKSGYIKVKFLKKILIKIRTDEEKLSAAESKKIEIRMNEIRNLRFEIRL